MSKRKMCPLLDVCKADPKYPIRGRDKNCYRNTNSKCEIVKPKAKYKTIKGWAEQNNAGYWVFAEQGYETLQYPAELRIKTKYLKEKK